MASANASKLVLARSPAAFLEEWLGRPSDGAALTAYEAWWEKEGYAISQATDRAGTPWVRMFDRAGRRVDEILYPAEYRRMVQTGYQAGAVAGAFEEKSLLAAYRVIYVTSFYDPGLSCPYTVTLATAALLAKYGEAALRERLLPALLRRDGTAWQGATWMTEIKGGSDLGASVETSARRDGDRWRLSGDKYFSSNAGAELAVVAARPAGAPAGVRGLALFLLPRQRADGSLNYFLRRLKDKIATRSVPTGEIELRDSEAWLLGSAEQGIYLILEVLNISRVANSIGSVALTHRALVDALDYAERREAFGKPVVEHALLRRQFIERIHDLHAAAALAGEAARQLDCAWQQRPPYPEEYHLFRLVAHLAKYWTAELAAQTAKWGMEVHGGLGVLGEFSAERWLREAMILAIWEGTAHRQALDGLEVIEQKRAHRLLLERLRPMAPAAALQEMEARIEQHLTLPTQEKEAGAEELLAELAALTAEALLLGQGKKETLQKVTD